MSTVQEARDRVAGMIADLEGEHEAMCGREADPNEWSLDVKVADLKALLANPEGNAPTIGEEKPETLPWLLPVAPSCAKDPASLLAHLRRMPMTEWVWTDAEMILATLAAVAQPRSPYSGDAQRADLHGHVADEVRDACLAVLGKVVSFDNSRVIADRILAKSDGILAALSEHQGTADASDGSSCDKNPRVS
jgi:hypothetical protein